MMKKIFVFLSAIMLAVAFAVPAGAVDWDFYASVRFQTFNVNADENNTYYGTTGFDDRDSRWALNTVSRIGATVQNGDIGGRFEYGHTSSDVTLRRLYGTWNFGPGELLVGKDYTPIHFVTGQVYDNDSGLRRFGGFFTFQPMIQVKVDGFKLALISPNNGEPTNLDSDGTATTSDPDDATNTTDDRVDYDNTYPKVEVSYTLAMDTFSLKVFGGWNAFEVVNSLDREYDVTCYVYGVSGVVNVGPVTLKAMVWEGQNVGLYGLTTNHEIDDTPDYLQNDIRDNNGYGGVASIGVKINDVIGVEAGYGYVTGEDDAIGKDDNDDAWCAYLQAPITLAQGVMIVPEIGHYDYEKNDTVGNNADQGYETYFGAKWQIAF
ncbi:MAG: hypothetical protein KKI12_08645 [Proteobacteria bacterium]|nr:hypothetical protein [Pseudomonadota bacterium]MBU4259257.1 hypothetical protein [Pseudomonadota bacterium]MBU4288222.1 hypothetical protein [Pseudomonadota bacterium]MCG2759221.1 hypothetical protein [Desulfobacteraceae bacterium]